MEVDWESKSTIDNWYVHFGLFCYPEFYINLIGTLYFFSSILSQMIFPPLSDFYGRKTMLLLGFLINVVGDIIILYTDSIGGLYTASILEGIVDGAKDIVAFLLLIELVP